MLSLVLSGVVWLSAAQAPNVEGTRWVFPPGVQPKPIVVSFRADGVAEFSELKSTGHWKQSGRSAEGRDSGDGAEEALTLLSAVGVATVEAVRRGPPEVADRE